MKLSMVNEIVVIGAETLRLLASGKPVNVNGGRVLLIDASNFPRELLLRLR